MQSYTRQLRSDSISTLVPITSGIAFLFSLALIASRTDENLTTTCGLWLIIFISPATAFYSLRLANEDKQKAAGALFVSVHLLLIALAHWQFWSVTSPIPYFYSVMIIMSGMLIRPTASFLTWLGSTILVIIASMLAGQVSLNESLPILFPIGLNFFLAGVNYLSTMDWQIAIESTSELHLKVQRRRDELFSMKEELSLTNARLKYLNDQLDAARQAAENERDKRTRFMNNVSHELRTPLNAIVNFAYILEQGGRGDVNEQQADYLLRIEKSGKHLLHILNDLLDLARIESGEFNLHIEEGDLQEICEEAMSNTRGLIIDKEIDLIRDFPDEWPKIPIDKMRIKQSLINLLGNAAKYTEKGHIALRVGYDDQVIWCQVEDTGAGIDPKYHEAIFQEFRQVDDTAARRRIGTGLGLPIARHLIHRHGGQLTVASQVNEGSTFTITLPLRAAEEEDKTEKTPPESIEEESSAPAA